MNSSSCFKSIVFLILGILLYACDPLNEGVVDTVDQFNKEQEEIENYLSSLNINAALDSSYIMRYLVEEDGNDVIPTALNDSVVINFKGFTLDNTTTPFGEGDNIPIALRSLTLQSWRIGLSKIGEGGKVSIYSPSLYAYGTNGVEDVPGNTPVIFELELLEVKKNVIENASAERQEQFTMEIAAIDHYLDSLGIEAEIDNPTGLRYEIITQGNDNRPSYLNRISINYSGRLLNEDNTFDAGEASVFQLQSLIEGWQIGLPKIGVGGKIMLYIPSYYGYGTTGNGAIPANSTLVFEIELLGVRA